VKYFVSIVALVTLLAGCTKDIRNYDGPPAIYFQYAVTARETYSGAPLLDSSVITFAYSQTSVADSIIMLPIRTTGYAASIDRTYILNVADSSTAQAGIHYEIINSDYTIKAGKFNDTVYIRLHRTADMLDSTFVLHLDLKANENFVLDVKQKVTSGTQYVRTVHHTVKVNDILSKPKYWLDAYLGTFTRKKLYLMSAMLDIPLDKLNNTITVAEVVYYGKFMQRYFNEQKAAGTPILENDGTLMVMGALSQ
jgi:hypothetical protein